MTGHEVVKHMAEIQMQVNGIEFIEYRKHNRGENNWTVYILEFDNGKYYVGQTKQKIANRVHGAYQTGRMNWKGKKYGYSIAVTDLLKNGHLKTIWIHSDIKSEDVARDIETETIRALKTTDSKYGYNKHDTDLPAKPIKVVNIESGEELRFPSIKSAMKSLHTLSGTAIRRALKGTCSQALGYTWAYA